MTMDPKTGPAAQAPPSEPEPFHAGRSIGGSALREQARKHYQLGNRFFDFRAMERAQDEWRRAAWLWRLAAAVRTARIERVTDLRAVILLLLTVLLAFNLVYGLFPRNPADLSVSPDDETAEERTTWWERWLDTGHPQGGGAPIVTLRDWWLRLEHRWRTGSEEPEPDLNVRQDLDERWPDLVARYRRPGETEPLDYHLVAGYGFLRSGDFNRAAQAFASGLPAARRPKQRADLYQGLANAHYYAGYRTDAQGLAVYDLAQVRQAAQAYQGSVQAEPRGLSFGNLGWMYFLLGQYDRAEAASQRALRMDGTLHYVRLNLGLTFLVRGQEDDAYEAYRTVILAQPGADALDGGIDDLRWLLRDHPKAYPFGDLMLGLLARAKGDRVLAQRELGRFLAGRPSGARWQRLAQQALHSLDSPVGGL